MVNHQTMKYGFILIDKPEGPTSHDIVNGLRKLTGIRKIGHAGTLDPFATGLLILGIGREATKNLSRIQKLDKEYVAKIRLGGVSNTYDRTGKIILKENIEPISKEKVKKIVTEFIGEISQVPPIFSAKKIKGKKLYQLARKGEKLEPEPIIVCIEYIKLLEYDWPFVEIKVACSSGTYVRSLANDLGQKLGCGGYLEELCRTKIGSFSLTEAINLQQLNPNNWRSFVFNPL
jgi:tRNA pseudouridine55 synthase